MAKTTIRFVAPSDHELIVDEETLCGGDTLELDAERAEQVIASEPEVVDDATYEPPADSVTTASIDPEKPFACPHDCGAGPYKTQSGLAKHINDKHDGEGVIPATPEEAIAESSEPGSENPGNPEG